MYTQLIDGMDKLQFSTGLQSVVTNIIDSCVDIYKLLPAQLAQNANAYLSDVNVHGERQTKVDLVANDIIGSGLKRNPQVVAYISEEEHQNVSVNPSGNFLVAFDPLDGSGNLAVNGTTATIFSVLAADTVLATEGEKAFLLPGKQQLCAGYVLYGSSLTIVIADGRQIISFIWQEQDNQLVPVTDCFNPSANNKVVSANIVKYRNWPPNVGEFVDTHILAQSSGYSLRYQATIASDIHRIINNGGLYLYPEDSLDYPEGKIRYLYEASPLALITESVGLCAVAAGKRILDICPTSIHQTIPVVYGTESVIRQIYPDSL
ncbi:fructose-bisphosphatase class I [Neptunicella sp. SCSIO 80796]|uniref:fructose-bisphosphatase class I n=1 Tax=Neptunicella plasticusilytica TaxID=3117012 RepID=UPI003A4E42F3